MCHCGAGKYSDTISNSIWMLNEIKLDQNKNRHAQRCGQDDVGKKHSYKIIVLVVIYMRKCEIK